MARRLLLLPCVAAVAAAAIATRLPLVVDAVAVLTPRFNQAQAGQAEPPPQPVPAPAAVPSEPPAQPATAMPAPLSGVTAFDPTALTPGEIDVLQNLAKRRAELDARERELDGREALIGVAEARVDAKRAELQTLEDKIKAAESDTAKEKAAQIERLVGVYEKMKPVDAATIFDQLELPILVAVAGQMKQAKIAPILAAMDPAVAKALTVALANGG